MPISADNNLFQYSDFIAPLPAEFLLQGAMRKQQMYEEGRELVQSQLDAYSKIASEISKPEDREYFNKTMTSLVKAINESAGLDFSIKANVNSVMNIGKPLTKDKNIINAVTSSQNRKKMLEELAVLKPEERGIANDFLYMEQIQNYMSDGKVGSVLEYTPYTKYDPKVKELGKIQKDLNPTTKSEIEWTKDGRYRIKTVITGVDKNRIKNAYFGAIGESGIRQLQMDAMYKIRTQGKDYYFNNWKADQMNAYQGLNNAVTEAESGLKTVLSTYGQSHEKTKQYIMELEDLKKRRDIIAKRAMSDINSVSDSELVGYIIDKDVTDLSSSYSYASVDQDIKADEYSLDAVRASNDLAKYAQQKQIDLEYDMARDQLGITSGSGSKKENLNLPPSSAQETTPALRSQGVEIMDNMSLFGGMNKDTYSRFMGGFFKHFTGGTIQEDENGREIPESALPGKMTMKQMFERISLENTFDESDYKEIVQSLGGSQKAENFFARMKGLANNLGITPKAKDKNTGAIINDPRYKKSQFIVDKETKEIKPTSQVIVHFNEKGYVPYSKSMTIEEFLKLPAYQLTSIVAVDAKESTLGGINK
jgi:hypothetical protein